MDPVIQKEDVCSLFDTYKVLIIHKETGFRKDIRKVLDTLPLQKSRLKVNEVAECTEKEIMIHQPDIIVTHSGNTGLSEKLRSQFPGVKYILFGEHSGTNFSNEIPAYFFAGSVVQLETLTRQAVNMIKKETVNKAGKSFMRKFLIALAVTCIMSVIIYNYRPLWTIYFLTAIFVAGMLKKVLKIIFTLKGKKDDRLECL